MIFLRAIREESNGVGGVVMCVARTLVVFKFENLKLWSKYGPPPPVIPLLFHKILIAWTLFVVCILIGILICILI